MGNAKRLKPLIWLALLAACGCGSHDSLKLAPVRGTVTYQGKPLDHGDVVFNYESSAGGVPATGAIAEDGSYRMHTGKREGAPLGKCIVMVYCREKPGENRPHDMSYRPPLLIPEKYTNAKSPLRFEVKSGGNEYPIVLE